MVVLDAGEVIKLPDQKDKIDGQAGVVMRWVPIEWRPTAS